jgi:hypothetical protein
MPSAQMIQFAVLGAPISAGMMCDGKSPGASGW